MPNLLATFFVNKVSLACGHTHHVFGCLHTTGSVEWLWWSLHGLQSRKHLLLVKEKKAKEKKQTSNNNKTGAELDLRQFLLDKWTTLSTEVK